MDRAWAFIKTNWDAIKYSPPLPPRPSTPCAPSIPAEQFVLPDLPKGNVLPWGSPRNMCTPPSGTPEQVTGISWHTVDWKCGEFDLCTAGIPKESPMQISLAHVCTSPSQPTCMCSKMFSSGQFLLGRILKSATSAFASKAMAVEVEAFFKDKDTPGAERSISQALETIRLNAQWLERDRAAVKTWLGANV